MNEDVLDRVDFFHSALNNSRDCFRPNQVSTKVLVKEFVLKSTFGGKPVSECRYEETTRKILEKVQYGTSVFLECLEKGWKDVFDPTLDEDVLRVHEPRLNEIIVGEKVKKNIFALVRLFDLHVHLFFTKSLKLRDLFNECSFSKECLQYQGRCLSLDEMDTLTFALFRLKFIEKPQLGSIVLVWNSCSLVAQYYDSDKDLKYFARAETGLLRAYLITCAKKANDFNNAVLFNLCHNVLFCNPFSGAVGQTRNFVVVL